MRKTDRLLLCTSFIILLQPLSCRLQGQVKDSKKDDISTSDLGLVLKKDKAAANGWWWSWIGFYGTATIVQSGIAVSSSDISTKQDMWNGAATTLLGVVGLAFTPLVPKDEEIRRKVMSSGNNDVIHNSREYNEAMLKEIAEREKFGRSWKVHAVAGIVDLGSGLVTWLGFKRTLKDGLVTFAINTAVAEAQIWTQPIKAARDYEKYMRTHSGNNLSNTKVIEPRWYFSALPGGISVRCRF